MLPLRDVIPSRTTPYVTVSIIVVTAAAWIVELALPQRVLSAVLQRSGVVAADWQATSLFTSMFLHASWSQVIVNLWFLWLFGDNVEDRFGHARFAIFYVLCGVAAAAAHIALQPPGSFFPAVGSSGAIAGVMGAYFVLYPRSRVLTLIPFDIIEIPAVFLLGVWLLLQLANAGAIAVTSNVDGWRALATYAAGFGAGALGVFVFKRRGGYWMAN